MGDERDYLELAGWAEELVTSHIERMCEAGLLGLAARALPGERAPTVFGLTQEGHEMLNALRSGEVFKRLKDTLKPSELGALSLRRLSLIIGDLTEQAIRKKLGL